MEQKDFDELIKDKCEIHFESGEGLKGAIVFRMKGRAVQLFSAACYILLNVSDQIGDTPEEKKEYLKTIYDAVNSRL